MLWYLTGLEASVSCLLKTSIIAVGTTGRGHVWQLYFWLPLSCSQRKEAATVNQLCCVLPRQNSSSLQVQLPMESNHMKEPRSQQNHEIK